MGDRAFLSPLNQGMQATASRTTENAMRICPQVRCKGLIISGAGTDNIAVREPTLIDNIRTAKPTLINNEPTFIDDSPITSTLAHIH